MNYSYVDPFINCLPVRSENWFPVNNQPYNITMGTNCDNIQEKKVKNCIFKQKTYLRKWKYVLDRNSIELDENKLLEEKIIYHCDTPTPLLRTYEDFYIVSLDKVVTIDSRMRTSEDGVLYYIKPDYKDADNIEETRIEAEKLKDKCDKAIEEREEKEKKEKRLRRKYERYQSKSWLYKMFNSYADFEKEVF